MEHSGEPYHNLYVQRFDVEADKIVRITEYADPSVYLATGTPPAQLEIDVVTATPERAALLKPLG